MKNKTLKENRTNKCGYIAKLMSFEFSMFFFYINTSSLKLGIFDIESVNI